MRFVILLVMLSIWNAQGGANALTEETMDEMTKVEIPKSVLKSFGAHAKISRNTTINEELTSSHKVYHIITEITIMEPVGEADVNTSEKPIEEPSVVKNAQSDEPIRNENLKPQESIQKENVNSTTSEEQVQKDITQKKDDGKKAKLLEDGSVSVPLDVAHGKKAEAEHNDEELLTKSDNEESTIPLFIKLEPHSETKGKNSKALFEGMPAYIDPLDEPEAKANVEGSGMLETSEKTSGMSTTTEATTTANMFEGLFSNPIFADLGLDKKLPELISKLSNSMEEKASTTTKRPSRFDLFGSSGDSMPPFSLSGLLLKSMLGMMSKRSTPEALDLENE